MPTTNFYPNRPFENLRAKFEHFGGYPQSSKTTVIFLTNCSVENLFVFEIAKKEQKCQKLPFFDRFLLFVYIFACFRGYVHPQCLPLKIVAYNQSFLKVFFHIF